MNSFAFNIIYEKLTSPKIKNGHLCDNLEQQRLAPVVKREIEQLFGNKINWENND